jgi:hypothetical protein
MPCVLTASGSVGDARRGTAYSGREKFEDVSVIALLIFTVMVTSLGLAIVLCSIAEQAPSLALLICAG